VLKPNQLNTRTESKAAKRFRKKSTNHSSPPGIKAKRRVLVLSFAETGRFAFIL